MENDTTRGCAYQVRKTVQLLTQHAARLPPPCNLSVKQIKHTSCEWEPKSGPQIVWVFCHEIPGGREDRKCAADAIHDRYEVCEVEIPVRNQLSSAKAASGEVSWSTNLTREKWPSVSLYCRRA